MMLASFHISREARAMSKHIEAWSYQDTKQNFDNLFAAIASQRFLQMNGLGNEVPFFIFP